MILALFLLNAGPIGYANAADIQIQMDGVAVKSDVKPQVKNNFTLVPLRVVSENLGAEVKWSNSNVILTKGEKRVILKINSSKAVTNGQTALLDVKPYVKNGRTFVPLRFIVETFGCKVTYTPTAINIESKPLVIKGVKVKAVQQEYYFYTGSIIEQIEGNSQIEALYSIFMKDKGSGVKAPLSHIESIASSSPGGYYNSEQFSFMDQEGSTVNRFDLYSLTEHSSGKTTKEEPEYLVFAAHENKWYVFDKKSRESIRQRMDIAEKNGLSKIVSDTTP